MVFKNIYRKIKQSNFWDKNKTTKKAYRLIQKFLGLLLFFRFKIVKKLKLVRHTYYKSTFRIWLLSAFDNKLRNLRKARLYANKEKWENSKNNYDKLLQLIDGNRDESKLINESRMNSSLIDRILNIDDYRQKIYEYQNKIKQIKPKVAIVTAISGSYDSVKLPVDPDPYFDYYLFTDSPVNDVGIYKIKPILYFNGDKTRIARYVKTNLPDMLDGYEVIIWIDANIMIMEDIKPIVEEFIHSKKAVGAIPHPLRRSVYEEVEACKVHNKEDSLLIDMHEQRLRKEGYDCDNLIESNFMLFNMKDKRIKPFFNTWWRELDSFSKRDQLSLNYSLDRNNIDYFKIMKRPSNARNSEFFTLVPHVLHQSINIKLEKMLNPRSVNPYSGESFHKTKKQVIQKNLDKKIDIIYCVHNALEDVKICLDSVKRTRKNPNVKLIIVDDGSDKETKIYLRKFRAKNKTWVSLHRREKGSGYTKAANRGLKASSADLSILLNSDTIVTDGWTEKMANAVFSIKSAGIVGPLSSAASHQSIPDHKSTSNQTAVNDLPKNLSPEDMNKQCEVWSTSDIYPIVPLVHGFCFGVSRQVVEKVGYFDEENFPRGYGEENDYCFRAMDAGFKLVIATNTYVYHAKSKSYAGEKRIKYMKAGNEKLQELRGKERIKRAIVTMQENPQLKYMRKKASELY